MADFRRNMLPVDPRERLRDAFAQLLGQTQGYSLEPAQLWAGQAGKQGLRVPPPAPMAQANSFEDNVGVRVPTVPEVPGLDFPTAKPGGVFAENEPKGALFPKAESVTVEPSPFRLPPSPQREAKAKTKDKGKD